MIKIYNNNNKSETLKQLMLETSNIKAVPKHNTIIFSLSIDLIYILLTLLSLLNLWKLSGLLITKITKVWNLCSWVD